MAARRLLNSTACNRLSTEDQMSDEPKKDLQAPEIKMDPSDESLPKSELEKAVGGTEVSLPYGNIEWVYTQQKRD
jgi:hypothetical protein